MPGSLHLPARPKLIRKPLKVGAIKKQDWALRSYCSPDYTSKLIRRFRALVDHYSQAGDTYRAKSYQRALSGFQYAALKDWHFIEPPDVIGLPGVGDSCIEEAYLVLAELPSARLTGSATVQTQPPPQTKLTPNQKRHLLILSALPGITRALATEWVMAGYTTVAELLASGRVTPLVRRSLDYYDWVSTPLDSTRATAVLAELEARLRRETPVDLDGRILKRRVDIALFTTNPRTYSLDHALQALDCVVIQQGTSEAWVGYEQTLVRLSLHLSRDRGVVLLHRSSTQTQWNNYKQAAEARGHCLQTTHLTHKGRPVPCPVMETVTALLANCEL